MLYVGVIDNNGRRWVQPLFAPENKLYDGRNVPSKQFEIVRGTWGFEKAVKIDRNLKGDVIMVTLPKAAIVMKVGPHSNMSLAEIIESKKREELIHGKHYWGYSGSLCQPITAQEFGKWALKTYGENPAIVLLETKSSYNSEIGFISEYSEDSKTYRPFQAPVQLQGARFSFVARDLRELDSFCPARYIVYGGKNNGKPLLEHLRFRVNKSFATLVEKTNVDESDECCHALIATLVEPYAIWLRE